MGKTEMDGASSALRLLRFVLVYGLLVATLLWLAPMAGLLLEHQYEAMTVTARILAMSGLFAAIGGWQWLSLRQRWRRVAPDERTR